MRETFEATLLVLCIFAAIAVIIQGFDSFLNIVDKIRRRKEEQNRSQPYTTATFSPRASSFLQQHSTVLLIGICVPLAAAVAVGIYHFTRVIDSRISGWLDSFVMIGLVVIGPLYVLSVRRSNWSLFALSVLFLLLFIYGIVGLYLLANPGFWVANRLALTVPWALLYMGVMLSLFAHLILTAGKKTPGK